MIDSDQEFLVIVSGRDLDRKTLLLGQEECYISAAIGPLLDNITYTLENMRFF